MIEAVFFDFGGVVACLDHEEMARIERRYGLPQGGLWRAMYETSEWQALRIGQGTEDDWVRAIRRELDVLAGPSRRMSTGSGCSAGGGLTRP